MTKSTKQKVTLPPKTIIEYFKDKSGRRRGVFLSAKIGNEIRFSFAMCRQSNNPELVLQNDKFSEKQALNVAGGRLLKHQMCFIPPSLLEQFKEFYIRCYRYYKNNGQYNTVMIRKMVKTTNDTPEEIFVSSGIDHIWAQQQVNIRDEKKRAELKRRKETLEQQINELHDELGNLECYRNTTKAQKSPLSIIEESSNPLDQINTGRKRGL